ncbi:hypothetical protein LCGC14_2908310, partial [marine sediment metagenome]
MATKFEYYSTGDDNAFGIWGVHWLTQTFTPSAAHKITSVKLKLFRLGSPGTVTVSIRATSGGEPTGSDLCSGTEDGNNLTEDGDGAWYGITLGAGYDLDADTKYAIVAKALSGSDALNSANWRGDSSSPTYSGGAGLYSDNSGVDWAGYDVDRMFEDWGTANYTRSLTTTIGLSTTLSRAVTYERTPTTAIGLLASLGTFRNLASWLCIASRDGGS